LSLRAALVGCGRWGTKLLGALHRNDAFHVICVADSDEAARARAAALVPTASMVASLDAALDGRPDVVLLATPSLLHAEHALRVLEASIDVFVEKPLAMCGADAARLCEAAKSRGRIGMAGHVLRYHPAVERVIEMVHRGAIGKVRSVSGRRWTQSRSVDPLWTLGPHDLSTLHAIDSAAVEGVAARTAGPVPGAESTDRSVVLELVLGTKLEARFELSTTADRGERWLTVAGDHGWLRIDELAPASALAWSDGRGDGQPGRIELASVEPLRAELDHLAQCVRFRREPRTSFAEATWVVQQLELAQSTCSAAPLLAESVPDRREASP